jgi:hypothetical protein
MMLHSAKPIPKLKWRWQQHVLPTTSCTTDLATLPPNGLEINGDAGDHGRFEVTW